MGKKMDSVKEVAIKMPTAQGLSANASNQADSW